MNPIRNSLEPKNMLRWLRDVYVSPNNNGGNKKSDSDGRERMVGRFHSMNPESLLDYKKKMGLSEERFRFQALRFRKTSGPD